MFFKPLRSYSIAGSGKRAGKIGDALGAAFAVLECAIERGDELKLPLDSCIEGPHFANARLCLVAGGYAELCSPQYPRGRLGTQAMLPVPKSRGVQCLSESSVARLIYAIFIVSKTSSSVTAVPSTKQGQCSDIARSGPTLEAISTTSRLFIGQRAREIGRMAEGEALRALAAVNGPVATRTRFLGSCTRSAGAKPTRGGRVRRPGLIVANSCANGRNCLTEQVFPLHRHGLLALGPSARRPMPHTGFRGLDSASCAQQWL